MKTIKIFSLCLTLILALSGCSKSFLDTEMTGGTLSQDQFDELSNTNQASVRGLYLLLYADQTSSDHVYFGQKS